MGMKVGFRFEIAEFFAREWNTNCAALREKAQLEGSELTFYFGFADTAVDGNEEGFVEVDI